MIVYQSQNNMANSISKNIRKLRIKKGISQDRLSKDADLALNTVVKIETGEKPKSYC
jgi:DNA-binding XRE family transcriptional regulator